MNTLWVIFWFIVIVPVFFGAIFIWKNYAIGRRVIDRACDSDYVAVDEGQFIEFIDSMDGSLTIRTTLLHFDSPLNTEYLDESGRVAAQIIRWPNREYYMVKENWLTLMNIA